MKQVLAARIAQALAPYARHDSRFGRDFSQFIPAFVGSELAAERLVSEPSYRSSRYIFVTPDNALQAFRLRALLDGKTMVLPSYGLQRGFLLLEPQAVPAGQEVFASCLDGVDQFGRELSLEQLQQRGAFELLVAGASAVTTQGLRFGMGSHYLDVEWGLFSELNLVRHDTLVAVLVHDVQITDEALATSTTDVRANLIVTPTRNLHIDALSRPERLDWNCVDASLRDTPPLREFMTMSKPTL